MMLHQNTKFTLYCNHHNRLGLLWFCFYIKAKHQTKTKTKTKTKAFTQKKQKFTFYCIHHDHPGLGLGISFVFGETIGLIWFMQNSTTKQNQTKTNAFNKNKIYPLLQSLSSSSSSSRLAINKPNTNPVKPIHYHHRLQSPFSPKCLHHPLPNPHPSLLTINHCHCCQLRPTYS